MNEQQRESKSKVIKAIRLYHKSLGRLPDGNWFYNRRKIKYDAESEAIVLNGNYIDTELLIILARNLGAWYSGNRLLVPCPLRRSEDTPKDIQIKNDHKRAAKIADRVSQ